MTDDLVKRLREMRGPNVWEAADLIETLETALQSVGFLDVNVTVPDRDYSEMSRSDCYEAGLMDAEFAFRNTIKAHVRKALEENK